MLGRGEEDGALGNNVLIYNELEGVIVLAHVSLAEVYLIEVNHGVRCYADGIYSLAKNLSTVVSKSCDHDTVNGLKGVVGDRESRLGLVIIVAGLHDNEGACSFFANLLAGEEHGREESLSVVMECLKSAVIVNARPGCNGPDIVELPIERAHTSASITSEVLYTALHSLCLEELRSIEESAELGGIEESLRKIADDLSVSACVSLMHFHNAGEDVSILRESEVVNGLLAGEGLEAELGEITEVVISVLGEGLVVVPHLPIVRIAEVLVVRIDKSAERNGRGMYIRNLGANLLDDIGDDALEELDVYGNAKLLRCLGCAARARLDLVIAADDSKAGVVTESFKILSYLGHYVVEHSLIGHKEGASKGEVEEYDKTELVTDIEEVIVRIVAAAPDTDSVEVSEYASLEQYTGTLCGASGEDIVLGNVVSTHSEELDAVALMGKALAPSILLADKLKGTETYAQTLGINYLIALEHLNGEGIERLIAESAGPPEFGIADLALLVRGEEVALAVGSYNADRNGSIVVGIYERSNEHSAVLVALLDLKVGNARAVLGDESNASPHAHIGEHGTPVPAEHTMRLTDISESCHCLNVLEEVKIAALFLYVGMYVAAGYCEVVFTVNECVGNVKLVGNVHIVNVS